MTRLHRVRWAGLGIVGKALLWLWAKSCRIRVLGEDAYRELRDTGRPVILLIWHGRLHFATYFFRKRNILALVSPSQDGEIIAQIAGRWGYRPLRGSSSHSVRRAWVEMKRELQRGGELIITPDGPRGPARVLKSGCVKLAQQTGAFLIPFTLSASRKKVLNSWDAFEIIRPFSRVTAVYGQPIAPDSQLMQQEVETARQRVEELMNHLEQATDAAFQ